jgi:hypothetical protein
LAKPACPEDLRNFDFLRLRRKIMRDICRAWAAGRGT